MAERRPLVPSPPGFNFVKLALIAGMIALIFTRHFVSAIAITAALTAVVCIEALVLGGFNQRLYGFTARADRPILYWVSIAFGFLLTLVMFAIVIAVLLVHPGLW